MCTSLAFAPGRLAGGIAAAETTTGSSLAELSLIGVAA
jgi:hypothetical protein